MSKFIFGLVLVIALFLVFGCTQTTTDKNGGVSNTPNYKIEDSTNQLISLSNLPVPMDQASPSNIKRIALFNDNLSLCAYIKLDGHLMSQQIQNSCNETIQKGTLVFKDIKNIDPAVGLVSKCQSACADKNMEYITQEDDRNQESAGLIEMTANSGEKDFFSYCYCFVK